MGIFADIFSAMTSQSRCRNKHIRIKIAGMRIPERLKLVNLIFAISCLGAIIWYFVGSFESSTFSNAGFMPHGHCYLWTPALVWTMVTTDMLIGLAYVSISLCLYVLVRRIRLPFSAMFLAFGMFIAACGATHFMEVYNLWYSNYWLAALVKVITATASVATAIIMFPLFPRIMGFATAARLSEERKNQLELLNRELELKSAALQQANRELEAFSYSVSHDLRSPLRGIDGFSLALEQDYADKIGPGGKEYLQFIRQGAQRMGQIIDDLLNLSRMTTRELRPQDVDLTLIAKETLTTLKDRDPHRDVEILIQEGLRVTGDAGLLRIVMENLLSNAWKFTSHSVGARIEIGSLMDSNKWIFFVRDNGVGFDMAYAHKLFGAFQRLHSEEDYAGTGIGLATAKRIIDRHNGSIRAESEPGKGTTMYLSLGV
jgi:signal transduction histidine kinase